MKAITHPLRTHPTWAPASARTLAAHVRRVRRMPLSEIAGRGRQEAARLIERMTAGHRTVSPSAILSAHAPALARPGAVADVIRGSAVQRFFAGVEHPARVGRWVSDHRDAVVSSATATLESRFDLLGYRTLWFGEPIDWHLDPVRARRAPRVHWTQLNPLDAATVGDSKIVWELNRHQWVAGLAQAYALTRDERYAERALSAIESWIDANPYGIGVNWSSSLEVAYRIMSWTWTLMLLRDSAALSQDRAALVVAAIWLHARYVSRYLSYYFSPNTHLTGEALGLFYAGTLLPEFQQAARWRDLGARILVAESRTQICPDGVHFERATCYHRYTLETYLQFLLLAGRNHVRVPPDVADRTRRGLEFLLAIRRPDGSMPEIGDADGGRLMPLVERDQCDPRGVFALGAAMFERADFAGAAQGMAPDVLWLMGERGAAAFASLTPSAPAGPRSRIFPSGGYAVMSSSHDRDAHQMIVDVGPLGCSFSAGHGHADLLSVQCAAFGEPVLVDAGTYCYTGETEWRNFFRGTAAHSTLTIDGRPQVEPDGPFSWHGRARVQLREWRTSAEGDFVDAWHAAYRGLIHRRRVLFVSTGYWVIVDDVFSQIPSEQARTLPPITPRAPRGLPPGRRRHGWGLTPVHEGWHEFELGFQFAPMNVSIVRDRWAKAETPQGNTFWVGSFSSGSRRPAIKRGEVAPIRGWVSTGYGQRTPAPMLVFPSRAPLPWRSITVLMPRQGTSSAAPVVSALLDDGELPIGLELEDRQESILVDDSEMFRSVHRPDM